MTEPSLPEPAAVELSVQFDPTRRRITARGELDLAAVPVLAEVSARVINLDPGDITIDLADVSFIDAAGLGGLTRLANQLADRGAALRVVGASTRLRRVFDIVDLGGMLEASGPPGGRQVTGSRLGP